MSLIKIVKKILFKYRKYRTLSNLKFHFCVYLTEHCNLNCQMCNTFSPIAEPAFYSIEDYEKHCFKLAKLFKKRTHKIFLMGGEPLLHSNVIDFMRISRKNFPSKETVIELLTNGILLMRQPESFWLALRMYNIELAISKYPISLNYEEIEKIASKYGINISYHKGFVGDIVRKSYRYRLDENGEQNINNAYKCYSGSVSVLKYGKLYKCPICASINNFNNYFNKNLKPTTYDYIDLSKQNKPNDILMFLYRPSPFCRYCIIPNTNMPLVIDWAVSKKDIKEWT